jgi:NADH-quinone oxidoreductase subunit I
VRRSALPRSTIDSKQCIFAGMAWKPAGPIAITYGQGFEFATFNASSLIYRKEQLLAQMPAHEGAVQRFTKPAHNRGSPP